MTTKFISRPGRASDAKPCGEICWKAFNTISQSHNFQPDFPSADVAIGLLTMLIGRADIYSVVAEANDTIVGSNFLWTGDTIAGVGPITVDPGAQNGGAGRLLMQDVLAYAAERKFAGVRLVQAAFHNRSLSLYTKLGFDVREPLATMQGTALKTSIPGFPVRPVVERDLTACNQLCRTIHGHDRANELLGAIRQKTATLVEREGNVTGYATSIGFFGHAVAESNDDLKALITATPEIAGPGLLLPTRNSEVFRWCLAHGLRVTQPLTLMSLGLYNEPHFPFLPSILF
jgi:GNAT superfamily N-acetyltransferase